MLAGAAAAVTDRIGIGTAATNHNTRHPLVTATMATTLHRLSRRALRARPRPRLRRAVRRDGLPRVTGAQLEDVIGIYRTLWSGGAVLGHEGPAGSYPYLSQDSSFDEDDPDPDDGDRRAHAASWPGGSPTASCCTPSSPTRPWSASVRDRPPVGRGGRDATRLGADLGGAGDRRGVGPRGGAAAQDGGPAGDVPPGLRRGAGRRQRLGAATTSTGSGSDALVDGYPGAFDAVGTTEQLTYLRDEVIPAQWLAASATGPRPTVPLGSPTSSRPERTA